jgi:hypothetical protein
MEKPPKLKIPSEVYQSSRTQVGTRSSCGNGRGSKTTFALQTIEELASTQWGFYHSTRVSDHSLLAQFPWLRERAITWCAPMAPPTRTGRGGSSGPG